MTYRSDCTYSFCGHEANEAHEYPAGAFREFCGLRGIPYPIPCVDQDSSSVQKFNISEATVLMTGTENDFAFHWEELKDGYIFTGEGVEPKLQAWLRAQIKRCSNLRCPCYVLGGYVWVNALDAYPVEAAEFPKEAYYKLWLEHPMGLPCPQWFMDLSRDTLPAEPELPDDVAEELGVRSLSRLTSSLAGGTTDARAVEQDSLKADGLSAAEVHKVFQASPALRDVAVAFLEFLAIEGRSPAGGEIPKDEQKKAEEGRRRGLMSRLAKKAKEGGWARNGDKMSEAQVKVLTELLLGKNLGGAGNKKA